MDDHFWPAMYPGLFIGLLYGLSLDHWRGAILGAMGGLGGAILSYFTLAQLGTNVDLVSLALLTGGSCLGAHLAAVAGRWAAGSRRTPTGQCRSIGTTGRDYPAVAETIS